MVRGSPRVQVVPGSGSRGSAARGSGSGEGWAIERRGDRVELVDQALRQRDAVAAALLAPVCLELSGHVDALDARRQGGRVHVVDELVGAAAELVEWHESLDVEDHEGGALR